MTDWRKELIEEAEPIIERGWGKLLMTVTNWGKKRHYEATRTRIVDDKEVRPEVKK